MISELAALARRIERGDLHAARYAVALLEARQGLDLPQSRRFVRSNPNGVEIVRAECPMGRGPDALILPVTLRHGRGKRGVEVEVGVGLVLRLADAMRTCPTRWPGGHGVWHYHNGQREPCKRGDGYGKEAGGLTDEQLRDLGLIVPDEPWRA